MALRKQAGYALVEVAFAAAVISIGVGGVLGAMGVFARFAAHPDGPVRSAAALLAEQTLRVAQDAYKYGSPDLPSDTVWQTNVTVAGADATPTSVPVTVRTHVEGSAAGAAIEVAVSYPGDGGRANRSATFSLRGNLAVLAPIPGSSITRPGFVPDPSQRQ
jgi:Tfp pilus assembly protein PilV